MTSLNLMLIISSLSLPNSPSVMVLANQDGLNVSLSCEVKVVSEFRGFDEALTAK